MTSPKSSSFVLRRKTSEAVQGVDRGLEVEQPSGTPVQAAPSWAKSDPEVTSQAAERVACGLAEFQREYSFVIRPSARSKRSSKSTLPVPGPSLGPTGAGGRAADGVGAEVALVGATEVFPGGLSLAGPGSGWARPMPTVA